MHDVNPRLQHAIILARKQKQCSRVSYSRVKHLHAELRGHASMSILFVYILSFIMSRSEGI